MCLPATMLPTARISKEGNGVPSSASDGPPWTMSAHVIVLAGSCTTMLQGTTIVVLLIVTVPPRRLAWATSGHALLSSLTVACWMKPVSSKPWMSAGATLKSGSVSVGVVNGETTPVGGFAVPPPPLPKATAAPVMSMASPMSVAPSSRNHPCFLPVLLCMCSEPPIRVDVGAACGPRGDVRRRQPTRCHARLGKRDRLVGPSGAVSARGCGRRAARGPARSRTPGSGPFARG